MPAKFVVKKGTTGKFRFNLHATNGQVIVSSEAYETKRACMAGIASVQKNAPAAVIEDLTDPAVAAAAAAKKAAAKKAPAKKAPAKKAAAAKK